MLFNEPKLLKSDAAKAALDAAKGFSALQRAEIAEMRLRCGTGIVGSVSFSALQRAEIAEIRRLCQRVERVERVSVLFNEPKLLKYPLASVLVVQIACFSALQRAEIAEISTSGC